MNNSFIQCKKSNEEYTENLQWRKNLTMVFEKLGDKEQSSQSVQYLINQLQEMNINQLQFYIDCILENSENFNYLGKKEVIKLLGIAISIYKNKLSNYLNKIISFLVKRLTELPQYGILEVTLDTLGITCSNIIIDQKHLQKIGLNLSTIGSGSSGIGGSNNSSSTNGLIDIYFNPIFQLFNQPTRHTQIAGILACQKVIENIYDVNNLLRPQVNKVLNQLLKKLTISTVNIQSSSSMSSFPAQYCIPHTLSTVSSLFRVLGQNYFLYHCILPTSTIDQIQNNVISNCIRTLLSNDWTARFSACSLLLTIVEVLPKYYFSKRLNEILKSLNDCKFDKIKSIRDCVNISIPLYNQINFNQSDQIIPTTPSHIEAKFKLQEQQQHSNVYNSPNKSIKSNISSTSSSTVNSPSNQSPSLYSSNIRRPQLNNNLTTTTTTTTATATPSSSSSLPPSYPSSPSLKSTTVPSYSGLSSPSLKSKNYTSSLSSGAITSSSSSSFSSSKTLHPSSPGFKSMPVGSYASPPNSSSFNNPTSSSLSTSPLIYSNFGSDKKDMKTSTTFYRDIFNQNQQQQIQQQQQQIQQKQQQLEYQQKQRHLKQQLEHHQHEHHQAKQFNSIFNDNFSIINNDIDNQGIQENYNGEDEDEYNIHINNLKNHNHHYSNSFNHHENFNNLSISETSNNNNNSNNTNILTLSSLKSSPVSTPNKSTPPLKSTQNTTLNNNINGNNNNNNNNNQSLSPTNTSPKLNIKPKETITTTTTITTQENETVKMLNEMMQTMNDFMIETRESIGQIKNRLTVVESSVLTLQKYYLSK